MKRTDAYDGGPTQAGDPQRMDPSDPIGTAPAELPPMAVELARPALVVLRQIVTVRERHADRFAAWRATLAGEAARQIAGRNDGRRELLIVNKGPGNAYIGPTESLTPAGSSVTVAANATFTVKATAPVYACADAGGVPVLEIVAEFDNWAPDNA